MQFDHSKRSTKSKHTSSYHIFYNSIPIGFVRLSFIYTVHILTNGNTFYLNLQDSFVFYLNYMYIILVFKNVKTIQYYQPCKSCKPCKETQISIRRRIHDLQKGYTFRLTKKIYFKNEPLMYTINTNTTYTVLTYFEDFLNLLYLILNIEVVI